MFELLALMHFVCACQEGRVGTELSTCFEWLPGTPCYIPCPECVGQQGDIFPSAAALWYCKLPTGSYLFLRKKTKLE